jgi:aryl-alcohol dehydrogenase-like predicted oxidoreductase
VGELERFAAERWGFTVSRLAVAWTVPKPAVDAAIVGGAKR